MTQVFILAGSHRANSQSEKVARYIAKNLVELNPLCVPYVYSLAKNPLPFLDEDFFSPENEKWQDLWGPIRTQLQQADALVLITPEWHGMVTAGVKNFLLLCSPQDVGHKPALIVSVSAGVNGAYPIAELRAHGIKNNRICYIPDHVIVRHCQGVLNDPIPSDQPDTILRQRIAYSLNVLLGFADALKPLRTAGLFDYKTFPNGM